MKKYGYIVRNPNSKKFIEELKLLLNTDVEDIYVENNFPNKQSTPQLKKLLQKVDNGDYILVPRASDIYVDRFQNTECILYFKKNIHVLILQGYEEKKYIQKDNKTYLNKEYLINITNSNKTMGRPKIPKNKIDKIIYYRNIERLTYREISELTGLSLGTVYKYIRQNSLKEKKR